MTGANRSVCRRLQLDEIHPICSVPKCLVKTFCKRLSHFFFLSKRDHTDRENCLQGHLLLHPGFPWKKSGDAVDGPVPPCFGKLGRVTGLAGKGQRLNSDSNANPLLQKGTEKNLHASEFAN